MFFSSCTPTPSRSIANACRNRAFAATRLLPKNDTGAQKTDSFFLFESMTRSMTPSRSSVSVNRSTTGTSCLRPVLVLTVLVLLVIWMAMPLGWPPPLSCHGTSSPRGCRKPSGKMVRQKSYGLTHSQDG